MPDTSTVIVFIKAPVRGQVKSRLAASLGDERTLELYKLFVADIIETAKAAGFPLTICVYPPDAVTAVTSWLGTDSRVHPQQGEDLGERMENAFARTFAAGIERAVLVGSDILDISPQLLREALASLDANDFVIGPAVDGGYYLVGFRRRTFLPRLFHNIPWGTGTVFDETMAVVREAGLTVHLLRPWHDIDTIDDLKSLVERSTGTPFDKSRTMTYLRKTGIA